MISWFIGYVTNTRYNISPFYELIDSDGAIFKNILQLCVDVIINSRHSKPRRWLLLIIWLENRLSTTFQWNNCFFELECFKKCLFPTMCVPEKGHKVSSRPSPNLRLMMDVCAVTQRNNNLNNSNSEFFEECWSPFAPIPLLRKCEKNHFAEL